MIEFTMARVCLSVCGLLLLAAVIVPVTGMYESDAAGRESDVSDDIAKLIDNFYYSEMNEAVIPMNDILPNIFSYAEFDGRLVTLTTDRGVYKSGTKVFVISDGTLGYNDIIRLTKNADAVTAERLV